MTLAKAVISGTVFRAPEKRFTQNDIAVTSFSIQSSEKDGSFLLRVIARGLLAENAEKFIRKDDKIVVEGRFQTVVLKGEGGTEVRSVELDLQSFELISSQPTLSTIQDNSSSEVVKFGVTEELAEDLIGEEEIPF